MRKVHLDKYLIGILIGMTLFLIMQIIIAYAQEKVENSYKNVGGNIDIEYYLEVSEDSIWVEGVASKKYNWVIIPKCLLLGL